MMIAFEGIIWYLFLLDCLTYNVMIWTKEKWHDRLTHWTSKYFPLNGFFGAYYLVIILWLGFALYRLNLLGF